MWKPLAQMPIHLAHLFMSPTPPTNCQLIPPFPYRIAFHRFPSYPLPSIDTSVLFSTPGYCSPSVEPWPPPPNSCPMTPKSPRRRIGMHACHAGCMHTVFPQFSLRVSPLQERSPPRTREGHSGWSAHNFELESFLNSRHVTKIWPILHLQVHGHVLREWTQKNNGFSRRFKSTYLSVMHGLSKIWKVFDLAYGNVVVFLCLMLCELVMPLVWHISNFFQFTAIFLFRKNVIRTLRF